MKFLFLGIGTSKPDVYARPTKYFFVSKEIADDWMACRVELPDVRAKPMITDETHRSIGEFEAGIILGAWWMLLALLTIGVIAIMVFVK